LAEQIRERAALMLDWTTRRPFGWKNRHAIAPDGRRVDGAHRPALAPPADQRQMMAQASYVSAASPPPFAGQFAEVEVDTETGQVTVTKLVMAVDAGVPINPLTASGQVEGGMVQALGYGHCEEMAYDEDGNAWSTPPSAPTTSTAPTKCPG
jgi:putative selenate reductase molybdopterin-binding subunit